MGGKSKIAVLAPELKAEVDRLLKSGRTIKDIVAHLGSMGAEVSKSSVGRYKRSVDEELAQLRETEALAAIWADRIGKEPTSPVADAAIQVLSTAAFHAAKDIALQARDPMVDDLGNPLPTDIKALKLASETVRNLAQAGKLRADQERSIRQLVREEQEEKLAQLERERAAAAASGKGRGLDPDTLAEVRRTILGI